MIVILASCEHHFIIVHENLVQHPSNNISITKNVNKKIALTVYVIYLCMQTKSLLKVKLKFQYV